MYPCVFLLAHMCHAKLHVASRDTQRGNVLTSQHCRLEQRSTLNPSCSSIPEEQVLLADINYPSLMKTSIHGSRFYTVGAEKLRQSRLVRVSLQHPPQTHISTIPSPESKPRTTLPALHQKALRLEIPESCGCLGIKTSSKGRNLVIKVKSIPTEM